MLHAGFDLSRKRLDVCVLADDGTRLATTLCPPDADGLWHLVREVRELGGPVQAVIESMNGARFVQSRRARIGDGRLRDGRATGHDRSAEYLTGESLDATELATLPDLSPSERERGLSDM
jgi:hypothetical protein